MLDFNLWGDYISFIMSHEDEPWKVFPEMQDWQPLGSIKVSRRPGERSEGERETGSQSAPTGFPSIIDSYL